MSWYKKLQANAEHIHVSGGWDETVCVFVFWKVWVCSKRFFPPLPQDNPTSACTEADLIISLGDRKVCFARRCGSLFFPLSFEKRVQYQSFVAFLCSCINFGIYWDTISQHGCKHLSFGFDVKLNWAMSTAETASLSAGSKTPERGTVCAHVCELYTVLYQYHSCFLCTPLNCFLARVHCLNYNKKENADSYSPRR